MNDPQAVIAVALLVCAGLALIAWGGVHDAIEAQRRPPTWRPIERIGYFASQEPWEPHIDALRAATTGSGWQEPPPVAALPAPDDDDA